jgi:hypothetical protein
MLLLAVDVAVIVTGPPAFTPVANPDVLTVAIAVLDDSQFTLTAPVVPSEKCPVAVNCCVKPADTVAVGGATVMDCKTAVTTIGPEVPVIVEVTVSVAVIVWLPVVFRVTENVPVPLPKPVLGGKTACPSVLVKCSVPE